MGATGRDVTGRWPSPSASEDTRPERVHLRHGRMLRLATLAVGVMLIGGLLSACAEEETVVESDAPDDEEGDEGEAPAEDEVEDYGTVSILLNWLADAPRGPYIQISAAEIDSVFGFEADLEPGGPGIATIPPVAAGEFDYGVSQAGDILTARAEGIPVVAIFGGFDNTLFSILAHADVEDIHDLEGKQFGVRPGQAWWPWLEQEYDLEGVETIDIVDMAVFVESPDVARQDFVVDGPCVLPEQGVEFTSLPLADLGFNPYTNPLFTTEEHIRENPDEVRAVVQAARQSWETWVEDDTAAREAVFELNPEEDPDNYECAREELVEGDYIADDPGEMTEERWQELFEQLVEVEAVPEDLEWQDAFTTEFLGD